ncbi:helix-turn-helix domain-containing protein [Pseudonocardia bannensis]|uniref:MerR family transcriptional regulator n=1 Tax=Pseudonocardia bannensis TaxID=630973 RepID=A0A848DD08_9PSEU|nr:helix-turn-helix domain-containing protein [Pseudonocardia bannensis]NMH90452.1 MerR family transcriptional regulator [Pseudonocardia bannensis]
MNLNRLDDEDYPAVTMGQAAELLGVQPAFLRSLDAGDVIRPHRTGGGHRRYSRRQLSVAARLRALFDEGHTLASAHRIVTLEDELAGAGRELREAQSDLDERTDELAQARSELRDAETHIADLTRRLDSLRDD